MPEPPGPVQSVTEVGATGTDLAIWRAREAVRNAELRLSVQVQAMQALEQRATTLIGWCVAVILVAGAASLGGTRPLAAGAASISLLLAASLSLWALSRRPWVGGGLQPRFLLEDDSPSEYQALVGIAKSYQAAIEENSRSFHLFRRRLDGAIAFFIGGPAIGVLVLALT